jgi:hypothetical protein
MRSDDRGEDGRLLGVNDIVTQADNREGQALIGPHMLSAGDRSWNLVTAL